MLIRLPHLITKTGRKSSSIYERLANGLLPAPVKSGRSSLWVEAEIDAVLATEAAGASDDEIRSLVQELVAARPLRAREAREAALGSVASQHAA